MNKLVIAAAALMAGSAALAQVAPVAPPAPMARPMADKVMTRAEVVAMVRDHFGRLDADKNGSISTAEADNLRMKHPGGAWQGENSVRRMHERRMGDPAAAFDRLDVNKDGAISRDEFAKGHERRIEKRVEIRERRKDAARDGRREMRMHRMGGMMGGHMIAMADGNHDGMITLAEAEAMALQHFDQMDSNRDGQVTPEERRAGLPMIIKKVLEQNKTAG